MAFENGDNAFDYCSGIFKKYREDNLIFVKALQCLQFFQTRSDYPYCTEQMSEVLLRLVGYDIDVLVNSVYKYTLQLVDDKQWDASKVFAVYEPSEKMGEVEFENLIADLTMEESAKIVESFKCELQSFLITISPLLDDLLIGDASTNGLQKIAIKQTYDDNKVVRFIRNDDQYLDFALNKGEIETLCETLSQVIEK